MERVIVYPETRIAKKGLNFLSLTSSQKNDEGDLFCTHFKYWNVPGVDWPYLSCKLKYCLRLKIII